MREFYSLYGYLFADAWPWHARNMAAWDLCSDHARENVAKAMNMVHDGPNVPRYTEAQEQKQWIFDAIISGKNYAHSIGRGLRNLYDAGIASQEHMKVVTFSHEPESVCRHLEELLRFKILPNKSIEVTQAIYEVLQWASILSLRHISSIIICLHQQGLLTVENLGKLTPLIEQHEILERIYSRLNQGIVNQVDFDGIIYREKSAIKIPMAIMSSFQDHPLLARPSLREDANVFAPSLDELEQAPSPMY
jgi:hypothetical protein